MTSPARHQGTTLHAIIGVIDLKQGRAVHAIAGKRDQYQPLAILPNSPGDPRALIQHYLSLGLRRFYLADLDAICGKAPQSELIHELLGKLPVAAPEITPVEIFLDQGRNWQSVTTSHPIRHVLSTEAFDSIDQWIQAALQIAPANLVLGLDLADNRVRTANHTPDHLQPADLHTQTAPWLQAARRIGCRVVIALDLQYVGTAGGVGTVKRCQQLCAGFPDLNWISGGGVRSASDIRQLQDVGCGGVLVGTALHRESEARRLLQEFASTA